MTSPRTKRHRRLVACAAGTFEPVQTLAEQTLTAIGRMTVAASDLEHLLAWIGGDTAALGADPLPAARAAAGPT